MKNEDKIRILQLTYAGVLADAVLRMGREGVLEKVTREKKQEQMLRGKKNAEQFGITQPEEVFLKLSEIFNCASWEIMSEPGGFSAQANACKLCGFAKKFGAQKPCNLYCLDPMEGMVKGLNDKLDFTVRETLWDEQKCKITVKGIL
ncbi:hypothetical protein ACFLS8_05005 [Chloroflexota bacterium]